MRPQFDPPRFYRSVSCTAPFPQPCSCGRALLLLLLLTLVSTAQLLAQSTTEVAMGRAFKKGNLLTAIAGTNWRQGLMLAAAHLRPGQTIDLQVPLEAKHPYTFLGTAHTERALLDLHLLGPDNRLIQQDTAADATPVIQFTPPRTGLHTLRLHLRGADTDTLGVALALLDQLGNATPTPTYQQITRQYTQHFTEPASIQAPPPWQATGQWSRYALLPHPGRPIDLIQLPLPSGKLRITTAAAAKLQGLNLYLSKLNGTLIANHQSTRQQPHLNLSLGQTSNYHLRIEAVNRRATGLILLGFHQQ